LQLDSNNTGVQPKLALIRDLFAPGAKGVRPAVSVPVAASVAAAKASAVAPAVAAATPPKPATPAAAATAPVAPTQAPAAAVSPGVEKDVEAAVRAWAAAWSSKDMNRYLASYGKEFDPPGNQARKAWEDDRRSRIVGKARISVTLNNLAIQVNGGKATARFRQDYHADTLNVSSRKTLDLVKAGDRWVIVKESTGA
jgi:ketosteroid isomerase-like protein